MRIVASEVPYEPLVGRGVANLDYLTRNNDMTFSNDPNLDNRRDTRTGFGWGLPLGIAAIALLLGFYFLGGRDSTTTATDNTPSATTTTPAPTPAPAPSRPSGG